MPGGAGAAPPDAGAREPLQALAVLGEPGSARIRVLDCESGRPVAEWTAPAALTAAPALSPDRPAVYAATATRELLRLSVPALLVEARGSVAFAARILAASGGSDALLLAAGAGTPMLSAHEPDSLAVLHEYRLPEDATVASIVDLAARRRFAVGFVDLAEAWEIAYDPDAPPVLQGLVHDYRMREAVELPGRLTARRFRIASPTRSLVAGSVAHELLRVDVAREAGIVNLDVRREIERPALGPMPDAHRIAAWGHDSPRGWLVAREGSTELQVLEAAGWRTAPPIRADGEVLALAADAGAVLVALARGDRLVVATLEVASRAWKTVASTARAGKPPFRFVAGTAGCLAVVDGEGDWVAGFRRETRAAARNRGS